MTPENPSPYLDSHETLNNVETTSASKFSFANIRDIPDIKYMLLGALIGIILLILLILAFVYGGKDNEPFSNPFRTKKH